MSRDGELRRHTRAEKSSPIQIVWQDRTGADKFVNGKSLDISPSGMRVEVSEQIDKHLQLVAATTQRMHVGLNLIFLVPGETGGMEVAARELIPALLAEAPAGMRFTAFINREAAARRRRAVGRAAARGDRARERAQPRAVGARRAGAAAAAGRARGRRSRAQPGEHGARCGDAFAAWSRCTT